jgi:ubiquinone/menaquinone biosynthesis C-methylase UbiE
VARANAEAIDAWNGVLFEKFTRFQHLLTKGLSGHSDELLRRPPPGVRKRALDIGCGFGDTALELAALVGADGEVVGVDAAERFVLDSRCAAQAAGVRNARFLAADVQADDLGGPYDLAFSRFGTMFFASPVAAILNVRRALAPEGRLPAGEIIRLAGERAEALMPAVDAALREALSPFARDGGVYAPSSTWFVTARAV